MDTREFTRKEADLEIPDEKAEHYSRVPLRQGKREPLSSQLNGGETTPA